MLAQIAMEDVAGVARACVCFRGRNILEFVTYPRTVVLLGSGIERIFFLSPCMGYSGCCHGSC